MKKITAIVQARLGSSRFKKKILKKVNNQELILFLISKLKLCVNIKDIIVAIPKSRQNDFLYKLLEENSIKVFRGSEENVLKRYYECAKKNKLNHILRITSDCPLIDTKMIDFMAKIYSKKNYDYYSNILHRSFPVGMDAEFFSFKSLEKCFNNAISKHDKEHVTKYMQRSPLFKKGNLKYKHNLSDLRITLDYKEDYELIKKIILKSKVRNISLLDILKFYKKNPQFFIKNKKVVSKYEQKNNL